MLIKVRVSKYPLLNGLSIAFSPAESRMTPVEYRRIVDPRPDRLQMSAVGVAQFACRVRAGISKTPIHLEADLRVSAEGPQKYTR